MKIKIIDIVHDCPSSFLSKIGNIYTVVRMYQSGMVKVEDGTLFYPGEFEVIEN